MKTKAYLYIISAAVCWGLIGLFVRTLAAQGFSSMQIVALRSLAAAICVTLPLLRSGRAALRIRLRDLWLFVGTGICSLVFFNYCYFNAMQQTSLAVAALLLYTAPVFVMLMSLLCFGEAFTFYLALAASWPLADFDYQRLAAIDLPSIVSVLGLGLLCAVLPYLLYTKGLEQIEAGQASILATIEPFVAAAVGVIFFAEALTPVKIIGMGLIFAAIAVLNIRKTKKG